MVVYVSVYCWYNETCVDSLVTVDWSTSVHACLTAALDGLICVSSLLIQWDFSGHCLVTVDWSMSVHACLTAALDGRICVSSLLIQWDLDGHCFAVLFVLLQHNNCFWDDLSNTFACMTICQVLAGFSSFSSLHASVKIQGGHQPGKHGKVREFASGQGKIRENVLLPVVCYIVVLR